MVIINLTVARPCGAVSNERDYVLLIIVSLVMKINVRRHLGLIALRKRDTPMNMDDLRRAAQLAFDDVSVDMRHNLLRANYRDILRTLDPDQ
jgi:hypothetical protein